jgi:hypothetical protein
MKKIMTLIALVGLVIFSSCEGPEGPAGYDGPQGPKGDPGFTSEVYEVTNISFTSANNYSVLIPLNPAIYTSDMVLVYRLVGDDAGADIWKLLPEVYYTSNGTLDFGYEYDFTAYDVSINMFGSNLQTVGNGNKLNQILRIVILPGSLTSKNAGKQDFSDYHAVIKKYNIDDSNVKRLN